MKKQPLYQVILNDIKNDILTGKYQPDEQIPTELDLAERYGVSRITSKRALAELENQGFIYRLRGKGSFVKEAVPRKLSGNKTDILFVMPFPKDIGFGNYTQGIFQAIEGTAYRLVVQSHESLTQDSLSEIIQHYAGIIFYPINRGADLELLYSLFLNQIPTVILDKEYESIQFTTVVSDNQQGGFEATNFLLKTGLKKVAFVSSQPIMEISTVRERYLGYLKALHQQKNLNKCLYEDSGHDTQASFVEEVVERALKDGTEGLVVENDLVAIALVNHIKQRGISIPKTLSLVGFDNIQASQLIEPKLTTVGQNFTKMGLVACQKLIEQIESHQPSCEKIVIDVDFIERETTKNKN